MWKAYQQLLATGKYRRINARPGDVLPVQGIHAVAVGSDGVLIAGPFPRAGTENPDCQNAQPFPADQTENGRSLGTRITFGKLRILDLGDLTRDKEMELICPRNRLGKIDVYIVSHHGWSESGSPEFVNAIARVAIMDNGARKGGSPSTWDIIEKSLGLENLWQLHFSEEGGAAHNVPAEFIANPDGPDAAYDLELTAWPDGSFEVLNSRTGKTRHYAAK